MTQTITKIFYVVTAYGIIKLHALYTLNTQGTSYKFTKILEKNSKNLNIKVTQI
ncbi:MAG: hypothetical protein WC365_09295 [Candidatus Babeliales bacterium]